MPQSHPSFESLTSDIRQRTQELDSIKRGPGSGRHPGPYASLSALHNTIKDHPARGTSTPSGKSEEHYHAKLQELHDNVAKYVSDNGIKDNDVERALNNASKELATLGEDGHGTPINADSALSYLHQAIEFIYDVHIRYSDNKSLKATPQLSAFIWSPYLRAYVPASGRPVDTSATRKIVDEVRRGSQERLAEAALKLQSGELTNLTQFSIDMKDELRNLFTTTHILARGGLDEMDNKDWGMLGQSLKEQYSYVNSMVRDIENGNIGVKDANGEVIIRDSGIPELSDGFLNRVGLYTESAWGAAGEFEAVVRDREMELGSLERRVLGNSKVNCDECIELANRDWQPPGLMPDIGDTECQAGCNCEWEFENQELDDLAAAFGHPEIGVEGDTPTEQPSFTLYPDEGKSLALKGGPGSGRHPGFHRPGEPENPSHNQTGRIPISTQRPNVIPMQRAVREQIKEARKEPEKMVELRKPTEVSIKDLTATQYKLNENRGEKDYKTSLFPELGSKAPIAARTPDGQLHILDGHYRIDQAIKEGKESLPVRVIHISTPKPLGD